MKNRFILTEDHLKLLRHFNVDWNPSMCGAPAIDSKRPYGNTAVYNDIHRILTGESIGVIGGKRDELTDEEEARYERLHNETQTALQIVLKVGKFEAGDYECGEFNFNWKRVDWAT